MTGIVVGVDGSEIAAQALRWAAREAALRSEPLTAILAWGFLDQHHASEVVEFNPEYADTDADAALASYIEVAFAGRAVPEVQRRTICELPANALLQAAEASTMLVVGARGHGVFRSALLGSVSRSCLNHATHPIAIIHPASEDGADHPGRVVVGIDGSAGSLSALGWAVDDARLRRTTVDVVTAWHLPYIGGYPYTGQGFDGSLLEQTARTTLDEAIAATDSTGLVEPIRTIVSLGDAATAILDAAHGADLVVVGSRGLGGFSGMLLGSVSHYVAHHALCPAVVVPTAG